MNGRVLLDTNIVIALFAGDASVRARLVNAEETFVPSIVLGELYYGARKSGSLQPIWHASTNSPPVAPSSSATRRWHRRTVW